MTMRRHLLLAEHYRLMCLLLENREAALYGKFAPMIAEFLMRNSTTSSNGLTWGDRNALQKYVVEHAADFPPNIMMPTTRLSPEGQPTPSGDQQPVALNTLISQTPMFVQALTPDQQKTRAVAIANAIILMIWSADPSPKKAYSTWMLYRFMAKQPENRLALEDLPRTRGYLELFDKVKNHRELKHKLAIKDINQFKSTTELFDAIKNFRENENGEMVSEDYVEKMYRESEVVYDGDDFEIVRPLTKDASCWFGRGTEWCTAYAPPKTNNMFSNYNSRGSLFIVRDKSSGDRWQFFVPSGEASGEFRDEADRSIDIRQFLKDHPSVNQVFDDYYQVADWEVLGNLQWDNVAYFGPEGDHWALRVAKEGAQFGGLLRDAVICEVILDKDMNVTGATGSLGMADEGEAKFREILDGLKAKGNCESLTEANFVWTKKGWGTILDVKPFLEDKHWNSPMSARRIVFSPGNEWVYLSYISGIERSDHDLATIKVEDGTFTMHHHVGYVGLDEDQEAFLAEVVLSKGFDPKWKFDAGNSNIAMPAIEKLADARPQWMDLGKLWEAKGSTPLVRERLVALLKQYVDEKFDYRFAPGDENKVIVDGYPNVESCVEEEGDSVARFCAKVMQGTERHEYSSGDISCPEHDYLDFFQHLEKSEKDLFDRLCRFMEKRHEDAMPDLELEKIETPHDLETLMEEVEDEDLKQRLDWAYAAGHENGADAEAIKALKKGVEKNPYVYFENPDKGLTGEFEYDVPVVIVVSISDIMDFGSIGSIDTEGLNSNLGHGRWLAELDFPITVQEPHYGFQDYDEEAAMHDFEYRIEEMLDEDDA